MAIQTRIKQRFDPLSSWIQNDIVLLKGELAIVDCENQIRFKIGDGTKSFTQLPFVDQNQLCTYWIVANAISQGLHASSVPYGFAAGAYLCANANFSQALGFDAQTISSDTYSFVWNGDDKRIIGEYYNSHGKGTFNVNSVSGLNGIYIGEQSLADILDDKSGNKITIDNHISGFSTQSDLSIVKLSSDEYCQLVAAGNLLSNCIYIVEDSFDNAYGRQLKNLAAPTDLSDATTKEYVDNAISSIQIPTDLSDFTNSPGYVSKDQVSAELSVLDEKIDNKVFIDNRISGISAYSDLNVVRISSAEYASMLTSDSLLSNAIYIVEDDHADAYGQQIKNVAQPTDLSDATNKEYVDNSISNSLVDFYKKSETSSANEISIAIESIDTGNKIFIDDRISSISGYSDLSVVKLNASEYATLLTSDSLLSNSLYIVNDDHIDAYGQQLKNLAAPTDLSDAATKEYVDNAISNVEIPEDLSAFTNSPGYLVSNDLSDYCYFKSETSSAVEISQALEQKSKVMFVEWED